MKTNVLGDGSHYAKIRSIDGKRSIKFLTIRPNHKRRRDRLTETIMVHKHVDFLDF